MSFDENTDSRVTKITFKDSFGSLKAISLSFTADKETPMFEAGRNDRTRLSQEHFDFEDPANLIRVRVHSEKGKTCITGLQLSYVDSTGLTEPLGLVDLHDFGAWQEHRLAPGEQIIGIHGLQNNLIRSLGFIIMNVRQFQGGDKLTNGSILNCGQEDSMIIESQKRSE